MRQRPNTQSRPGTSAVEFAVVLPFLLFMVVIAVDFARVYRNAQVVMSAARNGALYGSDNPTKAADTDGIQAAALQEAVDLSPAPTVTSTTGTDTDGSPYVRVTVSCPFQTITRYPGVPASMALTRTVQMRICPLKPNDP
jgi:Flp pilus assembly protein TadG